MKEHTLICESVRVDRFGLMDSWFTIEASFTLQGTTPDVAEMKVSELVEVLLSRQGIDITKATE